MKKTFPKIIYDDTYCTIIYESICDFSLFVLVKVVKSVRYLLQPCKNLCVILEMYYIFMIWHLGINLATDQQHLLNLSLVTPINYVFI